MFYDPHAGGGRRLGVCETCGSELLALVGCDEYDDEQWLIVLRCGSCGQVTGTIAGDAEVDAFCRDYQSSLDRLADEAGRLAWERMSAEIDAFVTDLRAGRVTADDFAR